VLDVHMRRLPILQTVEEESVATNSQQRGHYTILPLRIEEESEFHFAISFTRTSFMIRPAVFQSCT
jgi:hypothetical protein